MTTHPQTLVEFVRLPVERTAYINTKDEIFHSKDNKYVLLVTFIRTGPIHGQTPSSCNLVTLRTLATISVESPSR